jgi:hypothetical protein
MRLVFRETGTYCNRLLDAAARPRCSVPGNSSRYRLGELRRPGSKRGAPTPGYGSRFLADIFQNLSRPLLVVSCRLLAEPPRARFRPLVFTLGPKGSPRTETDLSKATSEKCAPKIWRVDFGIWNQTYKLPGLRGLQIYSPSPRGLDGTADRNPSGSG